MVSHKTIHSMAMVGLEKNTGKTIDTNGWNLKNHWETIDTNGSHEKKHWKTIDTNGSHVKKTHWKTIDYNGTLTKTINHSIVVKNLPLLRSIVRFDSELFHFWNMLLCPLNHLNRWKIWNILLTFLVVPPPWNLHLIMPLVRFSFW